jgi:hypothetical protein
VKFTIAVFGRSGRTRGDPGGSEDLPKMTTLHKDARRKYEVCWFAASPVTNIKGE